MEKTNALTLIITLVVGVILTGALLGPVIGDATKTTGTLNNANGDQLGTLEKIDSTTEYTLTWDVETPNIVNVNGNDVSIYAGSIICGGDPDFIIRYWDGSTKYIQGRDGVNDHNFTANSTCTITISNGTATIVADGTSYTYTVTDAYAIAKDGQYVMKSANQIAYMLDDSEFNAYGVSGTDGSSVWIKISGTIANGATVEQISGQSGTFSDVELHYSETSGYIGVYSLEKLTLTFTNTNTGVETPLTYNYFIVPAEVTAELSEHLTPGQISLMGAIPVMVIVALLMIAVGAIAYRRAD